MTKTIMLWILVLLMLIGSVNAALVTDAHGVILPFNGATEDARGVVIMPLINLLLVNVTINSTSTATQVFLMKDNGTIVSTQTVTNYVATFNEVLDIATEYAIVANTTVGTYTQVYQNDIGSVGVTFPIEGTNLNITASSFKGLTRGTNQIYNIQSILTDTTLPDTTDSFNITAVLPPDGTALNGITSLGINATVQSNQSFDLNLTVKGFHNQSAYLPVSINITYSFNFTFDATSEVQIDYNFSGNNFIDTETSATTIVYIDNYAPRVFVDLTGNYTEQLNMSININDTFLGSLMINDTCGYGYHNTSIGYTEISMILTTNITYCPIGEHNITFKACDAPGGNELNCYEYNLTWGNLALLRVYAIDWSTGDAINFTMNFNNETIIESTDTFVERNNLTFGDYYIELTAENYATTYNIINLNSSVTEYNITMSEHNSIYFQFRDEETLNLITNLTAYPGINMEMISDTDAQNYTTPNGTLYLSLLFPEFYTMRYSATGYDERFYYLNLVNKSTTNVTLYLINSSTTTEVTATVIDETSNEIEGAFIKVLRYDLATNSYVLREIGQTNFEGEVALDLTLNDEFYQFIIEYPLGTIKKITTPTYIYANTIAFQITLGEDILTKFYNIQGIDYTLIFNNETDNFVLTFSDSDSVMYKACLDVYKLSITGDTLLDTGCADGTAGTILVGITPENGTTYEGKAYFYIYGASPHYVDSVTQAFAKSTTTGKLGLFLTFVMFIVGIFMFAWSPTLGLVIAPAAFPLASLLNLTTMPFAITSPIWLVCIIIAFVVRRKR